MINKRWSFSKNCVNNEAMMALNVEVETLGAPRIIVKNDLYNLLACPFIDKIIKSKWILVLEIWSSSNQTARSINFKYLELTSACEWLLKIFKKFLALLLDRQNFPLFHMIRSHFLSSIDYICAIPEDIQSFNSSVNVNFRFASVKLLPYFVI